MSPTQVELAVMRGWLPAIAGLEKVCVRCPRCFLLASPGQAQCRECGWHDGSVCIGKVTL